MIKPDSSAFIERVNTLFRFLEKAIEIGALVTWEDDY